MTHPKFDSRPLAVPGSRLSRLARLGGLASGIAGGMAVQGARQFAQGKRPSMGDLLLTPANAIKVADQLAQMRGAAMKVGQLLSMDAGDMLPPELAQILGRLRAEAHHMPGGQLKKVLTANWGADWLRRFQKFEVHPLAAASIGQVHRALTKDGRDLAIKVQYPGVRQSIDSDVTNVAALMRLSGLVPKGIDLAPMLDEAKRQLHEEADYEREGRCLAQFGKLLAGAPDFAVPVLQDDLTTNSVLAMSFVAGVPVDDLAGAPQDERDRIVTLLIGLLFRELFEFQLMQTDANFANYRYSPETGQLILLDFGATRSFTPGFADGYRRLMRAGLAGDRDGVRDAAVEIGFLSASAPEHHRQSMMAMFEMSLEPLRQSGRFDFAATDLPLRLRDAGMAMGAERDHMQIPPMDTLFLQRKFGGVYLLASRLGARVDLRALLEPHL
ncbi:AarF/ABC1/UbiB kinase family protein [Paracoccaceae bacterium Fryx2]|nr:AarF/ABC1/UbiB kinase family protein [Paracoccaceae bacterium Fryx2]